MIIDFRLQVFQKVAEQLSFTTAARSLFISQPAVTKHINELEKNMQRPLFHRQGRQISLTPEGKLLLTYTREIMQLYEELDEEIQTLQNEVAGRLHIGASTTIAQYVLPAILAQFKRAFPKTNLQLLNGNTRTIESSLLDQKIDLGLIEGQAVNPLLHYSPFIKDEIVLVTRADNRQIKKGYIPGEQIGGLPLVLREKGSGTLAIVLESLKKIGFPEKRLKVEMELGSTESVKQYLMHSNAYAFLSIHTILPELTSNQLKVIEISGLEINRTFQFVSRHGQHSNLYSRFRQFCLLHDNQKE